MSRLDFLYRMELPHRAISVYTYLADRADKNGECWPAIPTVAKELKLSQSTVRRALHDLRKAGCGHNAHIIKNQERKKVIREILDYGFVGISF